MNQREPNVSQTIFEESGAVLQKCQAFCKNQIPPEILLKYFGSIHKEILKNFHCQLQNAHDMDDINFRRGIHKGIMMTMSLFIETCMENL